jgi:hypothetical protein
MAEFSVRHHTVPLHATKLCLRRRLKPTTDAQLDDLNTAEFAAARHAKHARRARQKHT